MKYYCVTTSIYDNGAIHAALSAVVEADAPPANTYKETSRCDIYNDYFRTQKEAEKYIREAKYA